MVLLGAATIVEASNVLGLLAAVLLLISGIAWITLRCPLMHLRITALEWAPFKAGSPLGCFSGLLG